MTLHESIEAFRVAMIEGDRDSLLRLTSDALSYGHTSGLIEDKQEFVKGIGERDEFKSISVSELSVQESGPFAIVRHRFQAEVLIYGKKATPDIQVLQVWIAEEGEWKLLARQAFRLP